MFSKVVWCRGIRKPDVERVVFTRWEIVYDEHVFSFCHKVQLFKFFCCRLLVCGKWPHTSNLQQTTLKTSKKTYYKSLYMREQLLNWFENIAGKGVIVQYTHYEPFLHIPECLQKSPTVLLNVHIVLIAFCWMLALFRSNPFPNVNTCWHLRGGRFLKNIVAKGETAHNEKCFYCHIVFNLFQ